MPGYGIAAPDEGGGLLPWSWAVERITESHEYWVATVGPERAPHVMPVWGVWDGESFWFSSGGRSRKALNLKANALSTVATDNPAEPVVMHGSAELITDLKLIQGFLDLSNTKYYTSYSLDFLDPAVNASFRVRPSWVFGLMESNFTGSPTRWTF
jgi:general stress protein 26